MTKNDLFSICRTQYEKQLPFVIYRKPNTKQLFAVLQNDSECIWTTDFEASGFVFAPFDIHKGAVLFPSDKSTSYTAVLKESEEPEPSVNQEREPIYNQKQKEAHVELVKKGIEKIRENGLRKVVLSRKEEIQRERANRAENVFAVYNNLLQTYPAAMVYFWFHPKVGLWLGATPETLFSLEGKTFRTMALAGTQLYSENNRLSWSEKEKEEQQLVTEFIEKSLEKVVPILMVSKPCSSRAGNLVHLRTDIGGTINNRICGTKELIEKLHPTPAVCGLPKEEAKAFIKNHEGYDREFYSGFMGELNCTIPKEEAGETSMQPGKNTDLYVNLRCMKISENTVSLYVGGGITLDSKPEEEWKETVAKSETLLKVLS